MEFYPKSEKIICLNVDETLDSQRSGAGVLSSPKLNIYPQAWLAV
jgi:hypothetical protein